MLNNILISRETRKVLSKDNRFIGIEGENLQEILVFNLDEKLDGQGIIEVQFMDKTKGFIEVEKTERGYELPVKSSLLTQRGSIEMQLRIIQEGQEIFKSEITTFLINEAINATTTIPEQYPTWIDNLEALKLNLENAEKERVKAEEGRIDAEKARVETFNQMGQAVDNAIGNIVDLQEAYDKNAQDKIKEFNDNATNQLKAHNTNATNKITEFNSNVDKQIENFDKHVEDKITEYDEHTEELTNRLDGIDEKDIDQDKLIENLKTQIIDLETENKNIKNQFPTGQAEGENITITDSSDMEFKELRIGGNRWQETRSGKNILKEKFGQYKSYVSWDIDNSLLSNMMYFSVIPSVELKSTNTLFIQYYPTAGKYDMLAINLGSNNYNANSKNVVTFNLTDEQVETLKSANIVRLQLYESNSSIDYTTITFDEPMLSSSSDTTYEKYGAMPSPEFRSEIRNVGDNVNLFDINELPTDVFEVNGTEFKCKEGSSPHQKYYWHNNLSYAGDITFKWKYKVYDTSLANNARGLVLYIYKKDGTLIEMGSYLNTDGEKEVTFSDVDYAYITYANAPDNTIYDFKIEKGSKATPYSPYNCGNFRETVCNGNLFDSIKIVSYEPNKKMEINDDGVITLWDNINDVGYLGLSNKLKELCPHLKVGDIAYLHLETTHEYKFIYLHGESNSWANGHSKTITQAMLDGTVAIYGGNGKTDTLKIMITLDKLATEYIPHQSQQFTFPLSEGQRMYKDSYLADDGVHHKRGQHIVMTNTLITLDNGNKAIVEVLPNKKVLLNNMLICSNAMFTKERTLKEGTVYENPGNIVLIGNSTDTLETLKAKYENSIVEYELAEEVIEPYTEEQQLVYNEIKKAHSYKNVTHIFSTDEIKPVLDVTYRKDLETMFNNINNAILGGN